MQSNGYSKIEIKRALHIYISFKIANLFLAFGFQVAVAKILLPPDFATYAVLLATLMAGERLLSFGIDRTVGRFVPALMKNGNIAGVRALTRRVAMLRAIALLIFLLASFFGTNVLNSMLPVHLSGGTLLALCIWFIAYTLNADADAFAQSWLAHYDSALAGTVEIVARTVLLFTVIIFRKPEVDDVIAICATTSLGSVIVIWYRLRRFIRLLVAPHELIPPQTADASFDPKRAPVFALANFASTMSYLIASPPVIRIVAAVGLDVIALAAFSFAQGLYISIQRIFPGLLILPMLEPIVMSQLAGTMREGRVYAGLSLLFKAELTCILAVVITTSIAGADIVEILSRPAYATYYYVLPILAGTLALTTSYRLLELIANTNYKQYIFFWLWPLSILAMVAMYNTAPQWGLISVVLWPIVEIVLRIGVVTFLLRGHDVWRAFDFTRSLSLIVCAGLIAAALFTLRSTAPMHFRYSDLILAAVGLICFLGSFALLRPLRPIEYETLVAAMPTSFGIVRRLGLIVMRD